jgi:hypothetical protein
MIISWMILACVMAWSPEGDTLWRGLVRVTPAPGFGDGASPQQRWLRG